MSKKTQANKQLKRANVSPAGGSNARERAKAEAQAAKRRKDRLTLIVVALVVVAVVVAAGIGISWYQSNKSPEAGPGAGNNFQQQVIENQPVIFGDTEAPNTVSVYLDFHCPHCIDFEAEFGPIITKAIDSGEWKEEVWPMSFIDPGSATAANAFACAVEGGFGRDYHDALFQNASLEWNNDQLISLADQVSGAPSTEFTSCVQNMAHGDWVDSINTTARGDGVTGTPTIKINGEDYNLNGATPESFASELGVQP